MTAIESQTGKLAPYSMLVQRYLIIKVAGRGGMSAIYQALDIKRDRRCVAIKEMSQEHLDNLERQEAMKRFQQEAHLLATLSHPHLPHIYDAFGAGGRSFLVMDYLDGKTLLQLLQETERPLAVDQVLHYADQLCDVLFYLHKHTPPIIFRDLKPTNVMITRDGHVYLIDFGIARFFKEGQPHDTALLGSPGYAPPEQHGSGQTTPRSDLYALGATLHCCLTNQDPYHAENYFAFKPIRHFNVQVPEALDHLVTRLLSLDEKQRPSSAWEVKQELTTICQQLRQEKNSTHMLASSATLPLRSDSPRSVQPSTLAYQPTQPVSGAGIPQGKLILPGAPVPIMPGAPLLSSHPHPPLTPYPGQLPAHTRPHKETLPGIHIWTPGFLLLFFCLLLVTTGGSIVSMSVLHPYGSANTAGLDHATEAALTVLAFLISITIVMFTRSLMAVLIILLTIAAVLTTGFAFLLQTLRDIQPSAQIFGQIPINQIFTYGLLVVGITSLLWLLRRSFTWSDRLWIFLYASAVCICAYLQNQYQDSDITKHLLLLSMLIVLIQGMLLTGQMERQRT